MRDRLPVLTSEIGDTWIYGYGSSPLRMARFRELSRLYARWIRDGRLDPDSDTAIDFAVRLGMISEHTWGTDVKVFLKNWDKYDFDAFTAARNLPEFRYMECSWLELDENIDKAIALLPEPLRREAEQAVSPIGKVACTPITEHDRDRRTDDYGRYTFLSGKLECLLGGIAYQTFSADDYTRFQDAYLTRRVQWAFEDNGKPGLENSSARSASSKHAWRAAQSAEAARANVSAVGSHFRLMSGSTPVCCRRGCRSNILSHPAERAST